MAPGAWRSTVLLAIVAGTGCLRAPYATALQLSVNHGGGGGGGRHLQGGGGASGARARPTARPLGLHRYRHQQQQHRSRRPESFRWGGGGGGSGTSSTRLDAVALPGPGLEAISSGFQVAIRSSGVQKIVELSCIAALGAALRDKLDSKAMTVVLLQTMVPAVIFSGLSSLKLSLEMYRIVLAGLGLILTQIMAGTIASRAIIRVPVEWPIIRGNTRGGPTKRRESLRRTAAVELGTVAPAVSVFSFTQEFAGPAFVGLGALANVPANTYLLLILPIVAKMRGDVVGRDYVDEIMKQKKRIEPVLKSRSGRSLIVGTGDEPGEKESIGSIGKVLRRRLMVPVNVMKDPYNAAIIGGLCLAATQTPMSSLGPFGRAVGQLAAAQTPLLFLIIGLKLKITGAAPALCASLLLARHGVVAIITALFLKFFLPPLSGVEVGAAAFAARTASRLAVALQSQASTSLIGFGQISKVQESNPKLGYDLDLAFQIVSLSFPLSVLLNTATVLGGRAYVDSLAWVGVGLCGLSGAVYLAFKKQIDQL